VIQSSTWTEYAITGKSVTPVEAQLGFPKHYKSGETTLFTITGGKGFQITFENGYTVSVQFGVSSQCSNEWDSKKNTPEELFQRIKDESNGKAEPESATAETALKSPSGSFVRYGESAEYDDVQSYMTPAQVLELLNYAAKL